MSTPSAALRLVLLAALLLLAAATALPKAQRQTTSSFEQRKSECEAQAPLRCSIAPTAGHGTTGSVLFRAVFVQSVTGDYECLVLIRATVQSLSPGRHGFHIHTFGDVSVLDGSSTGGHFSNPEGTSVGHGFPANAFRHWGDLGNIYAGSDGQGAYNRVDPVITLAGIVGRGMTLHAGPDLGPKHQPSGAAGARIGFCVIGVANTDLL